MGLPEQAMTHSSRSQSINRGESQIESQSTYLSFLTGSLFHFRLSTAHIIHAMQKTAIPKQSQHVPCQKAFNEERERLHLLCCFLLEAYRPQGLQSVEPNCSLGI